MKWCYNMNSLREKFNPRRIDALTDIEVYNLLCSFREFLSKHAFLKQEYYAPRPQFYHGLCEAVFGMRSKDYAYACGGIYEALWCCDIRYTNIVAMFEVAMDNLKGENHVQQTEK